MNTMSKTSLGVASVVLVACFLLCGGELCAGIALFGWILITRKAQSGRWVSTKARSVWSSISRVGAEANLQNHLQNRSMRHNYQTQRKLAR